MKKVIGLVFLIMIVLGSTVLEDGGDVVLYTGVAYHWIADSKKFIVSSKFTVETHRTEDQETVYYSILNHGNDTRVIFSEEDMAKFRETTTKAIEWFELAAEEQVEIPFKEFPDSQIKGWMMWKDPIDGWTGTPKVNLYFGFGFKAGQNWFIFESSVFAFNDVRISLLVFFLPFSNLLDLHEGISEFNTDAVLGSYYRNKAAADLFQ